MMPRIAYLASGLLGLSALLAPSPAAAQCRLCSKQSLIAGPDQVSSRISIEIESSLSFDRVLLIDDRGGTVTLRPDGSTAASGGLADISGRTMVGSAIVRGEPGKLVRVDLPKRIELHSIAGGSVVIEDVVSDLPQLARLDSTGRLAFRFGGRLKVTGDADGDYRGELPIFVDYL